MSKLLVEDRRNALMAQGRRGEKEKGTGKSRYEMRVNSKVASTVKEFNEIDMESLFVHNILTINVPVRGETNNYLVRIKFGGFLDILRRQLDRQNGELNLRAITRSLLDAFNQEDVYISCNCPDWIYRGAFWASMKDINSGVPERRPSKITNPRNNLGPGCKHIMLVLSNNSWLIKVASVIMNYIIYMEKYRKKQYADIIYPAIYGHPYEEPVQLDIDDTADMNDRATIDKANELGRTRGQFKAGNPYRFQPQNKAPRGQLTIDDEVEMEKENN